MKTDPIYGLPLDLTTRKVIVAVLDVTRSNPNGGIPDGAPRTDVHSHGFITNQCWKRTIRDYAHEQAGQELFYGHGANLTEVMESFRVEGAGRKGKNKPAAEHDTKEMLRRLWDLRAFGGALKAQGCLPFTDMVSVEPVLVEEVPFHLSSFRERKRPDTKDADGELVEGDTFEGANMGSYYVVNHGVYVGSCTYEPQIAARNGLTENDLAIVWAGLIEGWTFKRSAHRTGVNLRRVYVFDFPTARGSEQSAITIGRVKVSRRLDGGDNYSRTFEDYEIAVNERLPPGMKLYRWEDGAVTMAEAAK